MGVGRDPAQAGLWDALEKNFDTHREGSLATTRRRRRSCGAHCAPRASAQEIGATDGQLVYKANSEGECSSTLGGWFFTDSSNRAVRLCPKTCDTVKAQAGRVRLRMGCTPSVVIPE